MNLLRSIKKFGTGWGVRPSCRLLKRILGYLLAILLVIFLTLEGTAPLRTSRSYKESVQRDSIFTGQFNDLFNHPDLASLIRERAYMEALMELSGTEAIQLIINLNDSLLLLTINGVIIHEIPVQVTRMDRLLGNLPMMEYAGIFSHPLEVRSQYATIVKEPVVVRHAPKDSAEASLNAYEPDTLIQKPAFLHLKTDHHIYFIFEQDSNPGANNKWVRIVFWSKIRMRETGAALVRFLSMRKQYYEPTIILRIPARELRAIYRALPDHAHLVLSYERNKTDHP